MLKNDPVEFLNRLHGHVQPELTTNTSELTTNTSKSDAGVRFERASDSDAGVAKSDPGVARSDAGVARSAKSDVQAAPGVMTPDSVQSPPGGQPGAVAGQPAAELTEPAKSDVNVRFDINAARSDAGSARSDAAKRKKHTPVKASPTLTQPQASKPKRQQRWEDACVAALGGIQKLIGMQAEWAWIHKHLHEGQQNSPYAQKLTEIAKLDLQPALDAVKEAARADVPLEFGRD